MPGTFTFKPIKATLTHDTDWLGKMDPYCLFRTGKQEIKGPVCKNGGKFPEWVDQVSVPFLDTESTTVVDLMDKDRVHDSNIGSFVVDLQEIKSSGQISRWYPLYYRKKPAGEILMEAAFQAIPEQALQTDVVTKEYIVNKPVLVKEEIVTEKIVEKPLVGQRIEEPFSGIPNEGGHHVSHQEKILTTGASQGVLESDLNTLPTSNTQTFTETKVTQQGSYGQTGFVSNQPIILETSQVHEFGSLSQGPMGHTGLQQGSLYQGSLNQGIYEQSSLQQGTYAQSNLSQGSFTQGTSYQSNLGSGSLGQGTLGSDLYSGVAGKGVILGTSQVHEAGSLSQGPLGHGNLPQGTYQQGNLNQGNL